MEFLILALFLCLYIFSRKYKNLKIRLLSTSVGIFLLYAIAHTSVNSSGYSILKTILFNHCTPLYLLAGPSFYFFIKIAINDRFEFKKKHLFHLIPFVIQIIAISKYTLSPWADKMQIVGSIYQNPAIQAGINVNIFFSSQTNYTIRFIHLLSYFIISFFLLKKEKKCKKVVKLKRVTKIMIAIILLYSLHLLLIMSQGIYNSIIIKVIIAVDLVLLFVLIFEFIKSPELYLSYKKMRKSYLGESPYVYSRTQTMIKDDHKKRIKLRLEKIQENHSFFTDPKNNFNDFAALINYPDYLIRAYLKSENTSYIDIKNKVRLDFAKKILKETKLTYNLDYVAKKAGFNSRSNFFSIFKKYENCTPREYLKNK
ncbi:AraC family transcriptional regulator [uncultured Polaribacter sp.]|uniref:helix-turn-helix domain-containing protein n=1 Tax=uncultured Polaribacter sp. TaxID=174711 RepID=UPI002633A1A2|nr:AraC family transcriptional regulator [uncultured Polaribacter sp.]